MLRRRRTWLIVVATLLAVAFIVLLLLSLTLKTNWGLGPLGRSSPGQQASGNQPNAKGGPSVTRTPMPGDRVPGVAREKRSPEQRRFAMQGRVLSDEGKGLVGARLSVFKRGAPQIGEPLLAEARAQDRGAYNLELEFTEGQVVRVRVEMPGYVTTEEVVFMRTAGSLARDFVLFPALSSLLGRVIDAQGRGVSDALVQVNNGPRRGRVEEESAALVLPFNQPEDAHSAADGSFSFEGLSPGPIGLVVRPKDHFPSAREVELKPGRNTVEVQVKRTTVVRISVKNRAGEPVPGALVHSIWFEEHPLMAPADVNGLARLQIPDDAVDKELDLQVKAPRYLQRSVKRPGGVMTLEVVLEEAAQLLGRVTTRRGGPIEGCRIGTMSLIQTPDGRAGGSSAGSAVTDSDGRFSVQGVERGYLSVSCKAFPMFRRPLSADDAGREILVVMKDQDSAVFGRVVDSQGRPVTDFDADMREGGAEDRAPGLWEGFELAGSFHDPQGRFSFPAISAGQWTIFVSSREGNLIGQALVQVLPKAATEGIVVRVEPAK